MGEERLDYGDDVLLDGALDVLGGVLRRGGGLQRRRCLLVTWRFGAGSVIAVLSGDRRRLTVDSVRRRCGGSIACTVWGAKST